VFSSLCSISRQPIWAGARSDKFTRRSRDPPGPKRRQYDSNTRAYRVFNKSTGLVEVSCDIVFDETNGSQVEQVDLDELDDEEAPCVALRNISIGDVCPKESEEPPQPQDQPSSSMQASPPTQDEDQAQDDDDQEELPQEEDNDQGGMLMIKTRKMMKIQDRHTQESTKQFNEITP
jgi:hypothetical protein